MNRTWTIVLAAVVAAVPTAAKADSPQVIAKIAEQASGALVTVTCKIEGQVAGREGTISGMGICVNAQRRWFITLAISPTTQLQRLKDFRLVLPGVGGKSLKAKLLGVDPTTGIGVVEAADAGKWKEVGFAPTAKLVVGQQVVSVGLMGENLGRMPYVGVGYVSAVVRVPGQLAYVTGGRLTGSGSPVFAADGRAIGIVGQEQLPMSYRMVRGRQSSIIALAGREEAAFFLPVDEFVHVLRDPPTDPKPRRLAWIGATRFEEVGEELAGIIKLDRPGVMIDQIVPGHPADKAGLKNRDVIIAMDSKPLELMATPALVRDNFYRLLMRKKPGQTVSLTVPRGTKVQEFRVTLGEMPAQPYEAEHYTQTRLGFTVREKVEMDQYTDRGPTAKIAGLIVTQVLPSSIVAGGVRRRLVAPAADAGLKPGDLVTTCNNQPVKTTKVFQQIVEGAIASKPNEAINLLIRRGDQSMAISVRVPAPR